MNGPVHTIMGLSTGIVCCTCLTDSMPIINESPVGPAAFVIAITVGSTAPDLDLPGRPLGFLGHRKLTHTLLCPALCVLLMIALKGALLEGVAGTVRAFLFGFTFGYVLHILADLFQRKGVPLFWPILWSNVHIVSIPVKYDKYICAFYLFILFAVSVNFGNLLTSAKDRILTVPGIMIAVVIGLYEIKKAITNAHKQSKRYK